MTALFDKYLRKWLLGLAVTVRNRAQVVIAKMEPVEAEKGKDADRQAAPGAAQPARSGSPPAHWVRLVKRHAPELLQPGPPYAFPRESAQAPEGEVGTGESSAGDIEAPLTAGGALKADDARRIHAVPKLSLDLPRLAKEHDDPRSRQLKPDNEKQTSGSGGPPEAAAMPAKIQHVDSPQAAPRKTQAGSAEGRRFQSSPAGAVQSPSRRILRAERNDMPVDIRPLDSGTREAEAQAAQPPVAHRSAPSADPIAKFRAAGMERKNIRGDAAEKSWPLKQSGGRDAQFDRQVDDRQGDFSVDTSMPAQRSVIPEAVYESKPRPSEYVHKLRSSPDSEPAPSAAQDKWRGDDLRQAPKISLANEQLKTQPPEDGLKIEAIPSRAPEFRWPDLPGEKNNDEAAEALQLNPAWPDLPEEQSAGAGSFGQQIKPHAAEDPPRSIERLRRLDEEQRGMSWSASRF